MSTPFYLEDEITCLVTCDGVGKSEKRRALAAIQARAVCDKQALVDALAGFVHAFETGCIKHDDPDYVNAMLAHARAALPKK